MHQEAFAVRGSFIHAPVYGSVELLEDYCVGIDSTGRICFVVPGAGAAQECVKHGIANCTILSPTQFICPGLVDTHIHAPQYSYTGTATDKPLMGPDGWLESYTFPSERAMKDLTVARKVYSSVINRTLRNGTTTALYFGTADLHSSMLLADLCESLGQRGFVGKVSNVMLCGCFTTRLLC